MSPKSNFFSFHFLVPPAPDNIRVGLQMNFQLSKKVTLLWNDVNLPSMSHRVDNIVIDITPEPISRQEENESPFRMHLAKDVTYSITVGFNNCAGINTSTLRIYGGTCIVIILAIILLGALIIARLTYTG